MFSYDKDNAEKKDRDNIGVRQTFCWCTWW